MPSGIAKTKPILILGAGRSGFGAAKFLKSQGLACIVSDLRAPSPALADRFAELTTQLRIGPQDANLLDGIEELIVSPGISPTIPLLQEARRRKLIIRSEIDLALAHYPMPWIAITGTNGKSTCTHWLNQILLHLNYRSTELGNIGTSPSEVLADQHGFDYLVVELSSYQIEGSRELSPAISFFTSFSPDHLERHGTLADYFRAKWQLLLQTKPDGYCILTEEILRQAQLYQLPKPSCRLIVVRTTAAISSQADDHLWHLDIEDSSLKFANDIVDLSRKNFFQHEMRNAAMCLVAARLLTKASWPKLVESLSSLTNLSYRFQTLGHWSGKVVINDSKSTNVESTLTALASLNQSCYLLLGGKAKQESFIPIHKFSPLLTEVLVYGESKAKILVELADLPVSCHQDLAAALIHLENLMNQQPKAVLFSPACASFDGFENFEARGLYFSEAISSNLDT